MLLATRRVVLRPEVRLLFAPINLSSANGGTHGRAKHPFLLRTSILFRPHKIYGGDAGYRPRVRSAYSKNGLSP